MLNRGVTVRHDEIPEHLGGLIRASEIRVSAQIARLFALAESGAETREAEDRLQREMEILDGLRRQQVRLHALMDEPQT